MNKQKRSPWMQRHLNDPYVKKAQIDGYRSRAAYKILELDEKDRLFKPGMTVVDLGAAPGGWCQVTADMVGDTGRIIALDILPMDSFAQVEFIQGDFTDDKVFNQLLEVLGDNQVDLVISDMSPNMSGDRGVDQPRSMYLAELALDFACQVLKPGGDFLSKTFEGEGIADFRGKINEKFVKCLNRKPKSSRSESREIYLLGKGRIIGHG